MSEVTTLEIRNGDTVFVCRADGHCNLHYVEHGGHLEEMLDGFEQFLRGVGFSFDGHIDVCKSDAETQWAIDVRNFLDNLAENICQHSDDPEQTLKWIASESMKLRDA